MTFPHPPQNTSKPEGAASTWQQIYAKEHHTMSQKTAMLTWRILIAHAATYCKHLEETDKHALAMSANLHRAKDIKQWASERIVEILAGANELQTAFSQNADLWSTAQGAVIEYVERLDRGGFQLLNVHSAGGLKTEQGELL